MGGQARSWGGDGGVIELSPGLQGLVVCRAVSAWRWAKEGVDENVWGSWC